MCENKNYNLRRANTIQALARKNILLSKHIQANLSNYNDEQGLYLQKLNKNLRSCSSYSLYAKSEMFGIEYLGSHTCKNKNCFVCNYDRKKALKRKYRLFFLGNKDLGIEANTQLTRVCKIDSNGRSRYKVITNSQVNKYVSKGYFESEKLNYDLMHLTLNVPHNKDGFKGERYYFEYVIAMFHELRRLKEFKDLVYGGEYGIETTAPCQKECNENCKAWDWCNKEAKRANNGLHIHIHSLLFVKQGKQNRNRLYKVILKLWNKLTADKNLPEIEFTDYQKEGMQKSGLHIDFINDLYQTYIKHVILTN